MPLLLHIAAESLFVASALAVQAVGDRLSWWLAKR